MGRLVSENEAIPFTAGEPSADLFPLNDLKKAFAGVFDDHSLLAIATTITDTSNCGSGSQSA
jgi:hypothetical protein